MNHVGFCRRAAWAGRDDGGQRAKQTGGAGSWQHAEGLVLSAGVVAPLRVSCSWRC